MPKKIYFIILAIIVIAFAAFLLYREATFSKEILKVEILGPDTAKLGDEITYTVQYKNNGNFVLEKAKLTFVLPDNSLTEDSKMMLVKNINDIYPGDQESVSFKARLLGKDGDLKTAKASLSYVPKNITATYESDTSFITKIDASPITLAFDLPIKVEQGKDLTFSANYFSNVDYPLENLSIKIDPTPGFDFVLSEPKSLDNIEWKLPTLSKAQGGRINIAGHISATADQNLAFSASLGMWQNGNFIIMKQTSINVQTTPPLGLEISQKGFYKNSNIPNSGPTPPKAGQATTYTINWEIKNHFSDEKNVKVKAVLPKNVILTGKIIPEDELANFSFDSASRQIVWSAGDVPEGTGIIGDPVVLSFQISLTPDISQTGSTAGLIGLVQISGENQFINTMISAQDSGITTDLPDDIANSGGGIVQ